MTSEIDTPAKRARLQERRNPYWQGVSGGRGGVSLGYRRSTAGAGTWIAKIVLEKRRVEERIGKADDKGSTDGLPFKQAVAEALAWGRRQVEAFEARADQPGATKAPTVRSAIETYVKDRLRRGKSEGRDAERRLTKHVLAFPPLADLPLAKLRAKTLERWRDQLAIRDEDGAEGLSPSTVNRMMNDLRAALNGAVERHRRELPAHLALEVKIGTRAMPSASQARKQILTDADVAKLLEAAWAHDEDFGRLVLVLAATGCRYSQAAKIRVGDVQEANGRILVPSSAKGKGAQKTAMTAVPVAADVIKQLQPAMEGRSPGEFLLTHWHMKQVGAGQWVREKRSPWKANEMTRPWAKIREATGVGAEVVAYGLRHASIIRGLKAGLPIRLVASLHNTSSAMIEAHYGAFILDQSEELARRAMMIFAAPAAALPVHAA